MVDINVAKLVDMSNAANKVKDDGIAAVLSIFGRGFKLLTGWASLPAAIDN
jgi:hypothetical protein